MRMLRPAGRLLVDDYLYTGAVTEAIDAFHRSVTRRSRAGHATVTRRSRAGRAPVACRSCTASPMRPRIAAATMWSDAGSRRLSYVGSRLFRRTVTASPMWLCGSEIDGPGRVTRPR